MIPILRQTAVHVKRKGLRFTPGTTERDEATVWTGGREEAKMDRRSPPRNMTAERGEKNQQSL